VLKAAILFTPAAAQICKGAARLGVRDPSMTNSVPGGAGWQGQPR